MAARIRVQDHIAVLATCHGQDFDAYIARLKHRLSRSNPVAALTRHTIDRATEGLPASPERVPMLRRLLERNCAGEAVALLRRLTNELPPVGGSIACHLVPAVGKRGMGNCFGEDRILVCVPIDGDALAWLRFVIGHEYSHTQRGYTIAPSTTVRDHLIFEGLAMVLAEFFAGKPQPYAYDEVTAEQEATFWKHVDADARGLDAYRTYMNSDASYAVGMRIVREYMRHHGISVVEAHRRTNRNLYWDSGYPFLL